MKKSGAIAASVAAASATAISSVSSAKLSFPCCEDNRGKKGSENSESRGSSSSEKFAPRFDGLRFIETLVTAHR